MAQRRMYACVRLPFSTLELILDFFILPHGGLSGGRAVVYLQARDGQGWAGSRTLLNTDQHYRTKKTYLSIYKDTRCIQGFDR